MSKDLELLKTIDAYYPSPWRLFYSRCWGCRKRRFFAQWWEGYQVASTLPHGSALRRWGYFCSECTVVIASMCNDAIRFARYQVQIETLDDALDQFVCEEDETPAILYGRIERLRDSIQADLQDNGY